MNILFTEDGTLIPPHLSHTLKSYYYDTDLAIYYLDENYKLKDYYPNNKSNIEALIKLLNKDLEQFINQHLNCDTYKKNLTLSYTFERYFTFILSPVFHKKTFKGTLIAGPFCSSKEDINQASNLPIKKETLVEFLRVLKVKEPPRGYYLAQLMHHLLEKSIYIGPNHSNRIQLHNSLNEHNNTDFTLHNNSLSINRIVQLSLDSKYDLAIDLFKKTFLLGEHYLNSNQDNLNNLKNDILSLSILLGNELIQFGCDHNLINRIRLSFNYRILNTSNYQCLFNCGEEILQVYTKLLEKQVFLGKSKPVKATIQYIQLHYKDKIKLEDIANQIFVSKNHLSSIFKEETNYSIIEYVNKYRIEQSKYWLINSNLTILEIALECGFETQNYFASVFKNIEKTTPRQFRQQLGKEKKCS